MTDIKEIVADSEDRALAIFTAASLREWLYREGVSTDNVTDEHLLWRTKNTFRDTHSALERATISVVE